MYFVPIHLPSRIDRTEHCPHCGHDLDVDVLAAPPPYENEAAGLSVALVCYAFTLLCFAIPVASGTWGFGTSAVLSVILGTPALVLASAAFAAHRQAAAIRKIMAADFEELQDRRHDLGGASY